jgi:hypothetical protein
MECAEGIGLFIGRIKFSQRHTGPPEVYLWLRRTLRREGIPISESQDIKPLLRETEERLRAEAEGAGSEGGPERRRTKARRPKGRAVHE